MPVNTVSLLFSNLIPKTCYEWFDELFQFIIAEVAYILSECVQKIFTSLAVIISL